MDDLFARLASTSMETQAYALEEAAVLLEAVVSAAMEGYKKSTDPTITAERLILLGPAIVPALEHFVASEIAGEKRTVASILLLSLGSMKGLEDVLEAVKSGSNNQFVAAHKLADAGITQAGSIIIERLRHLATTELFKREQSPKFVSLLTALQKLNTDLPADLKELFSSQSVPREVIQVLKEYRYSNEA